MTRRLPHDRVPAPEGECHGPGACIGCGQRITMHSSGLCSNCGTWLECIPASEVRSGDMILDGPLWATVSTIRTGRGALSIDVGYRSLLVRHDAPVYIAANQRHKAVA